MKIQSKIRLDLIFAIVCIIAFLMGGPYFIYLKIAEKYDQNYWHEPSLFLQPFIFVIIWVAFVFYLSKEIVEKTLTVLINIEEKSILFSYPFKFHQRKYSFEDILAFRFSSYYTKICDFKTLVLKTTKNDQYTISEFQISNFNRFENFMLTNFQLANGPDFAILSIDEKKDKLIENMEFEITQAKSYKSNCYFYIGATVFISLVVHDKINFIGLIFSACILSYFCSKIIKANRKNYS